VKKRPTTRRRRPWRSRRPCGGSSRTA